MTRNYPLYPDFFIGGAQKCGTSALALWLNEHPLLVCSNPKETNFFSKSKIRKEHKDFFNFYPKERIEGSLLFEATTSTMSDDLAVDNIYKKMGGNVKFIFIVRDPVKRAVSAYFHMLKNFAEKRTVESVFENLPNTPNGILDYEDRSIQKALKDKTIDIGRYKSKYDNGIWSHRYLYNSQYSNHIKKFYKLFGSKNILILSLEKLNKEPQKEFDRVCSFLNIPNYDRYPQTNIIYNKTKIPIYLLSQFIRKNTIILKGFRIFYRILVHGFISKFFYVETPTISDEITKKLEKLLEDEIDFVSNI